MCSIYEFIYSFRDKKSDPFPDILNENVVHALTKLKEIKERISSGNNNYNNNNDYIHSTYINCRYSNLNIFIINR